jgi:hypothetical protein
MGLSMSQHCIHQKARLGTQMDGGVGNAGGNGDHRGMAIAQRNVLIFTVLQHHQHKTAAHHQKLVGLKMMDEQIVDHARWNADQHRFITGLGGIKLSHAALDRGQRADFNATFQTHISTSSVSVQF